MENWVGLVQHDLALVGEGHLVRGTVVGEAEGSELVGSDVVGWRSQVPDPLHLHVDPIQCVRDVDFKIEPKLLSFCDEDPRGFHSKYHKVKTKAEIFGRSWTAIDQSWPSSFRSGVGECQNLDTSWKFKTTEHETHEKQRVHIAAFGHTPSGTKEV